MSLVLAPIVKGKENVWRAWLEELKGPKRSEFEDFNKRYEITRHQAWFCETPNGPVVVAIHEGPGADTVMQKVGASDNAFDKEFVAMLSELHGLDATKPPPGPMPVLGIDFTG